MQEPMPDHIPLTLALCCRDIYVRHERKFKLSQAICNAVGSVKHPSIIFRPKENLYPQCMALDKHRFQIKLFRTTQILG